MQNLTLEQTADYLEAANIDRIMNVSHAIIHIGKNAAGMDFVLVNDITGQTIVSEAPYVGQLGKSQPFPIFLHQR